MGLEPMTSAILVHRFRIHNMDSQLCSLDVYDVVQFYPWFNFYFPLFSFMLIYDNEYKTKENKN